ncbi:MAG TPA: methyltransferase [Polyangiaceae bacterium]|nr:methyltransferase [Polyangiaceae bacterium]
MRHQPNDPGPIFDLALGFWGPKALLSAVELGVFAALAKGPRSSDDLARELGVHPRGARDFFDALVALQMLERREGQYSNTELTDYYLDPEKPSYAGGWLELAGSRLYPVWNKLSDSLRTGEPGNESKHEPDYYSNLMRDPQRLRTFLRGMTGLSMAASSAIAEKFPWRDYKTFVDVGGAQGVVAVKLAERHAHLTGCSLDLPAVGPFFDEYVSSRGLADRLRFHGADFFADPLPSADVLIMGHVLHNWDLERKKVLLRKAYDALSPGGALLVYEALIDDNRSQNAFGLLMSLNMLLVTSGGFVFTGADVTGWMRECGFRQTRVEHLGGPDSMVVAIK